MTLLETVLLRWAAAARVAQRLVSETRNRLEASDAMLWTLRDEEAALIPVLSARTPRELFGQLRVPVGESVVGMVIATGMPTLIGPGDWHNPLVEQVSDIETEWMIAAPVTLCGTPSGVLSAIRSEPGNPFEPDSLENVVWQAELIGIALSYFALQDHAP